MQLNNYNQDSSTVYQQFANKSLLTSIDKSSKSTFEKNDMVDISNEKNTQRDEESKKIENTVSSAPSLNNAKEEISKNGNLNKLFLQNLM
ncbi:MAG: hypothetical protein PHY66_08565 [Aliarcobacter sp.]|nr:hypothetical protein [Aliarcobacter sp.]